MTILPGAPPMFSAWLGRRLQGPATLSSVRLAVSGAAPLPREVLAAFRERFGVTIWEGYGLTEAAPVVTTRWGRAAPGRSGCRYLARGPAGRRGRRGRRRGRPGRDLGAGAERVRRLLERAEATAAALDRDGWLRTGDVAVRDDDGYLSIVDRKGPHHRVGLQRVPGRGRGRARSHPDVAEAAVVGMPDPRTGEAVQAWAVTEAGARRATLLEFLRGRLARFKLPKEIRIVDELPHLVTGKVLRRKLRPEALLSGEPDQGAGDHAQDGTT